MPTTPHGSFVFESPWVVFDVVDADVEWAPIPDELVLRDFVSLPVDDDEAVLAFLREYGWVVLPDGWFGRAGLSGQAFGALEGLVGGIPYDQAESLQQGFGVVHINGVKRMLALVRTLLHHWLLDHYGHDATAAWRDAGFTPVAESEERAWTAFAQQMNMLMAPGRPWIRVETDGRVLDEPRGYLQHALTVQIANLIAEEASVRTCKNPTCGSWFVRQQGRAMHDQFRMKNVQYCSALCAKQVANRRWRASRRADGDDK